MITAKTTGSAKNINLFASSLLLFKRTIYCDKRKKIANQHTTTLQIFMKNSVKKISASIKGEIIASEEFFRICKEKTVSLQHLPV